MQGLTIANAAKICVAVALLTACSGPPLVGTPGAMPQSNLRARGNDVDLRFAARTSLYGTTSEGGANGSGTVFAIDRFGEERVLHSFGGKGDGIRPVDRLTYADGKLYGTTLEGGAYGLGTVFSVSIPGSETVLHSFLGGPTDGASPSGQLTLVDGTLYGTTLYGGQHNFGTVFSMSESGSENIIHSFGYAPDGVRPYAGVIGVDGKLYGTTLGGGAEFNLGTVFVVSKSGAEKVLHSFNGIGGDGETPYASLHSFEGTLYGTTFSGGAYGSGTVFTISTSGVVHVIHSFGSPGDGANPYASLSNIGPTLYGTTYYGGSYNYGTVFAIAADGAETVLHSFNGSNPIAPVHNIEGALYGTTWEGGNSNLGTVFRISRLGQEAQLYSFGGGPSDGANPYASLIVVPSSHPGGP